MASIHKDPRGKSPFFYCAFTLPNGKRCFKSTKLKDHNAAMEFCLRMQKASQKAVARNFSEEQARKILNEIRELSATVQSDLDRSRSTRRSGCGQSR